MANATNRVKVYPCFKGTVLTIEETKTDMFMELGKGVAILPSDGTIYAPVDGKVTSVFPTKHIIGFYVEPGIEMLIHMGINTANLKGKPYKIHVKAGQMVKAGEVLGEVDLQCLADERKKSVTPILVTNEEECEIKILQSSGEARLEEPLYEVTKN